MDDYPLRYGIPGRELVRGCRASGLLRLGRALYGIAEVCSGYEKELLGHG